MRGAVKRTVGVLIPLLGMLTVLALVMGGCGGVVDKQANERLRQQLGQTSITVYPTFVRCGEAHECDAGAAAALAAFLDAHDFAEVQRSDAEVPINSVWGRNQSRMFRDSVADFAAYLHEAPPPTEYALLAEYLLSGKGEVMGVHLYLLTKEGVCAYAVGQNSHHQEFKDVAPRSVEDCTAILLKVMKKELGRAAP